MPDSVPPPARRQGIATWIAGVSLLALLPMLVFSAYAVYRQVQQQQAQAMVALQRRAMVAAAAVGHELDGVFAEIGTMAQAESVGRGDMAAAHALAQRLVQSDPRIASISVASADGTQPFSSARPLGMPLPPSNIVEWQRPVFASGARVVTPLVIGAVSQQRVVGLLAPLPLGPAGHFVVRAALRLESIAERLNEQDWPEDWTAAVLDQNDVILARSRDAIHFVGQPATDSLKAAMRGGQAIFHAATKDGVDVITSAAIVPHTSWHVVVGRPVSAMNAQVRESMLSIGVAGGLCAVLAVGGALILARLIGRQLDAVVRAHARPGGSLVPPASSIQEVAALSEALTRAQVETDRATGELVAAREQVLAKLNERSEMLDVLAHEVRQPLNNASAALQAAGVVLTRGGHSTAAEPLRRAETVLSEVQASIDNTLAVAALLVGHSLARQDVDIDALIAVTIADQPPADARRVRVERATFTRTAAMDPSLMRLALRNLLSNALRCSPREAPVVVRVADSDDPLALVIDVIDNGPGIADELLQHLFDRGGRRPQSASARRQGLGLYIVRRVMELHGGSVQLVRNGADGATMRLVIDQDGDD